MTAQTSSNLRTRALQVMNEIAGFANSEVRVGSLLRDMVDSSIPGNTPTNLIPTLSDDTTAATNTGILEALLVSGTRITLPVGTFYLDEGSLLGTVCLQFGASLSDIILEGAGEGVTVLKLKNGGSSHVINIDGATNIKIRGLTIDGNRDNNTGTSWHGIRTGTSGVDGLVIEDVTVRNTRGYGLGLQGGNKKRLRMTRVTVLDTGLDACDFKNTSDNSEDIVIEAFEARRWGLDLSVTEQAGLDCRGPCKLFGIWCSEGPADGHYIRMREGETVDPSLGGHYSTLVGFSCEGNSGTTSIGLYVPGHDVQVYGGYIRDCLLGVVTAGERVKVDGVTVESCDDESFQVNLTAENCRLTDCHSLSATGSGFRWRGPRGKMSGCSSGGDTVSGIVTEATATGFQSSGFDCEGTAGTMIGIDNNAPGAVFFGGDLSGCFRGLSTTGARTRFIGVSSHDNTSHGAVLAVGADDSRLMGCTLSANGGDGCEVRADRTRLLDNIIITNTVTGVDILVGADGTYLDANYVSGNGTPLGDAATGTKYGLLNDGIGTATIGAHSALAAETVTGYITVRDSAGVSRKLAVVS